jgi:hypothetical protein
MRSVSVATSRDHSGTSAAAPNAATIRSYVSQLGHRSPAVIRAPLGRPLGCLSSADRWADTPGVKRALLVLILGVLVPATLEGVAFGLTKSKPGANESAWWTTGTSTGEEADCRCSLPAC